MRYANEILTYNGRKFKQVNKSTARKFFAEGKSFVMQSCNIRWNNFWQSPCEIRFSKDDAEYYANYSKVNYFDAVVNEFEYYNCDNERGRYANFFVEV